MALRNWAIASSSFFWSDSAMPRLLYAMTYLGSSSMALRNWAIASSSFLFLPNTLPKRKLALELLGLI